MARKSVLTVTVKKKAKKDALRDREKLVDRAALVARLHSLGETRRAIALARNAINEHDKQTHSYARDSPAYAASFEHGQRMREHEAMLARDLRAAMTPRGTPVGMSPGPVPRTPIHLLPPLGVLPPRY